MVIRAPTGITRSYPNKNITLSVPRPCSSEVHPSLSAMLQIRLDQLLNLPVSILLILFSILKRELICSFRKALSWRAKSVSANKEGCPPGETHPEVPDFGSQILTLHSSSDVTTFTLDQ